MNLDEAYAAALARYETGRFDDLTEADRVAVTVWWLEADVNNGGFDQYFHNAAGDLAFFAVEALREIEAEQVAAIVSRAVSIFDPSGPPRDQSERQEFLHGLGEEVCELLEELDVEFYAYPDDVNALMAGYLGVEVKTG